MARKFVLEVDLPDDGSKDMEVAVVLLEVSEIVSAAADAAGSAPVRGWGDLPGGLKGHWAFKRED